MTFLSGCGRRRSQHDQHSLDEDQGACASRMLRLRGDLQLSCRQAMNAPLPPVVFRPRSCPFPTPARRRPFRFALPARLGGVAVVVGGRAQNAPDFERAADQLLREHAPRRGDAAAAADRRARACVSRRRKAVARGGAAGTGRPRREPDARVFENQPATRADPPGAAARALLFFGYGLRRLGGPAGSSNWPRSIPSLAPCFYFARSAAMARRPHRRSRGMPTACVATVARSCGTCRPCLPARCFPPRAANRCCASARWSWTIRTPFAERWGGWYVNRLPRPRASPRQRPRRRDERALVFEPTASADELSDFFPTADYLARRATSWRCSCSSTRWRCERAHARRLRLPADDRIPALTAADVQGARDRRAAYDSVKSVFASSVLEVVDRLLFRGEARLPVGRRRQRGFRRRFPAGAPRSAAGHALKDLRLRERIFERRCSTSSMRVVRRAARALRARIFERLQAVLRGDDPKGRYSYLGDDEKRRTTTSSWKTHPEAKRRWAEG